LPIKCPSKIFWPSNAPFSINLDKRGKLAKFEEKVPKFDAFGDNLSIFTLKLPKKR
jgi:hypothetical protein